MNDKAIEFESKKIEVLKAINKMKEAGLNVQKYEDIYQKILNNCTHENRTIPDSIVNSNTNFATDYLVANYNEAIKELELLYTELTKYEIYVRVSSFTTYLKSFIDKPYKTPSDFEVYRPSLIDILNNLVKSNTLDYNVEGNIIEEMYKIAYYFIKEELRFLGYSPVLDSLSNNQIHINYLDREITRELEEINFKDEKYTLLLTKKKELDSLGFNASYANENFLRVLVSNNLKRKDVSIIINNLIEKVTDNIKTINESNMTNDNHYQRNQLLKEISKNAALLISSLSITAGFIFGSVKATKSVATKYHNTITTYSIEDSIETNTEYRRNNKNSIKIYEVRPYQKELSYYTRKVITYDVTNIDGIPLEEYLDIDLASLGIKGKSTTERLNKLTLNDLYEETIRYVEQIEVNKEDTKTEMDFEAIFILIVLVFCVFGIGAMTEAIFFETNFNEGETISWYYAAKTILEDLKSLSNEKISKKEKAKRLNELNEKSKKLLLENKEMVGKLISYYEIIKDKKEYEEEAARIKKVLKRIKE